MSTAQRIAAPVRDLRARIATRPGAGVVDGALALAFAAAMVAERAGAAATIGARQPLAIGLSLVIAGALGLRRRRPLAGYLAGSAGLVAESLLIVPSPVSPYANLICVYSLGLYASRVRARLGLALLPAGILAYFAGLGTASLAQPAGVIFGWVLTWALGYTGARRQEERDASARLVRQRMVVEERARIAREVHDLVGHTLNVMLVQAGAARTVLDRDPAKTRDLLTGVEHTGREALDELDRVLGLLRPGAPSGPDDPGSGEPGGQPVPQPGLADLAKLATRIGQAGIRITVHVDPGAYDVPRSIELSAYRIVQEALTNTVKHGRAGNAEVAVRRDGTVLTIEVCDDGRGAGTGYGPGRGLLGIAERVAVFGGRVEHGGGERGGFRLHAVLPIP